MLYQLYVSKADNTCSDLSIEKKNVDKIEKYNYLTFIFDIIG